LVSLTAAAVAVPVSELRASSQRVRPVAFAHQSAMQLARVMLGLSYSATGRLFDCDRTTARMPAGWLRITGTIRPSTAYCSR
jgi:chromosomal replication initiation ATPase DnaA